MNEFSQRQRQSLIFCNPKLATIYIYILVYASQLLITMEFYITVTHPSKIKNNGVRAASIFLIIRN